MKGHTIRAMRHATVTALKSCGSPKQLVDLASCALLEVEDVETHWRKLIEFLLAHLRQRGAS